MHLEILTVVHGSDKVTAGTAIDNGGMAVGDYLVMSSVAYKVTALDTSNEIATLDTPYQGSSGTVTDANADFITAANAAAGNWGIKITGVAQPFSLGKLHYRKVRWETTLDSDSFGTTTLTKSQAASEGNGTYNQIAELEWGLNGNHGEFLRMGEPNIHSFLQMALSTETGGYDTIEIVYKDTLENVVGHAVSKKHLILAPDDRKKYNWSLYGRCYQ